MCNAYVSYIKIILYAVIATVGISSVYTVLSNVDTLQVAPNSEYNYVIDGIYCQKSGDNLGLISKDCYEIAKQMAHDSQNTPEWQCNNYTDYSSKTIYADILVFKILFIILILSSVMFGINASIHDCTLVYYSSLDQLDLVQFHPQKKDVIITWAGVQLLQKCKHYLTDHCSVLKWPLMCIIGIVVFIVGFIIFFLVDVIGIAVIYLVLGIGQLLIFLYNSDPCRCRCQKVNRQFLCHNKFSNNHISGISYVSSSFVALSRCFIMSSAAIMIANALGMFGGFGGENIKAPQSNPDGCSCSCTFVLPQTNMWGFVTTTAIIMITNFFFLKSWREEAYHGQYFLYLITYSLSIKVAQNLNPMNPAGDVVDKPFTSKYTLEVNKSTDGLNTDCNDQSTSDLELYNKRLGPQYSIDIKTRNQVEQDKEDWIHSSRTGSIATEMDMYYPLDNNATDGKNINKIDDTDMNKTTGIVFRWLIWLYSLVFSIFFIGMTIRRLGHHNPYGYRDWIGQTLYWTGSVFWGLSFFALLFYGWRVYKKR